jgi:drug/metabolite transporter (DMT)-like permease
MDSWYSLAIVASVLMGAQRFLYKVAAERGCSTFLTTFSFMATVAVLSCSAVVAFKVPATNARYLVLIALLNSSSFLLGTVSHIEALRHVPATLAYPIIRLNIVIVVLFSIFFFEDPLSVPQGLGIICAIAVIIILSRELQEKRALREAPKRGTGTLCVALLCGAIASISSKFAALYTNELTFMALTYILSALFSLAIKDKLQAKQPGVMTRDALIIGVGMGLINFVGYHTFLIALARGPLSIIAAITGMHFVIAIVLSAVIYRESLTGPRLAGIVLAALSVLLMRL